MTDTVTYEEISYPLSEKELRLMIWSYSEAKRNMELKFYEVRE